MRVAAVATLIVMVGYVLAAAVMLNLVVTNHLVGTADARLSDRLKDAQ